MNFCSVLSNFIIYRLKINVVLLNRIYYSFVIVIVNNLLWTLGGDIYKMEDHVIAGRAKPTFSRTVQVATLEPFNHWQNLELQS